jgi:hypothetical protein
MQFFLFSPFSMECGQQNAVGHCCSSYYRFFLPQNLSTCLAACQNNEHYTDAAAGNNVGHEDSSPNFQAAKIDPGLI